MNTLTCTSNHKKPQWHNKTHICLGKKTGHALAHITFTDKKKKTATAELVDTLDKIFKEKGEKKHAAVNERINKKITVKQKKQKSKKKPKMWAVRVDAKKTAPSTPIKKKEDGDLAIKRVVQQAPVIQLIPLSVPKHKVVTPIDIKNELKKTIEIPKQIIPLPSPKQRVFTRIDAKNELEKNIEISEAARNALREIAASHIATKKKHPDITWFTSSHDNYVFTHQKFPNLILKSANKLSSLQSRFDNMVRIKEACLNNNLDNLVVPDAQLFTLESNEGTFPFIAEKKLDIVSTRDDINEQALYTQRNQLDDTVHQLAILILKTGLSDLEPRNTPALKDNPRQLGLIDTEYLDNRKNGFLGAGNSRGLIGYAMTEKQIDDVLDMGKEFIQHPKTVKEKQLMRIEKLNTVDNFYKKNNIRVGDKINPLDTHFDTSALKLHEETDHNEGFGEITKRSMQQVLDAIIERINRKISQYNRSSDPTAPRRFILQLNTDERLPQSDKLWDQDESEQALVSWPLSDQQWPTQIFKALVKDNKIAYFERASRDQYQITL